VRRLKLHVALRQVNAHVREEKLALVHAGLGACRAACSGIQELEVHAGRGALATTSWLAGLAALRQLKLAASGPEGEAPLRLSASISRLQHLAEAQLYGDPLDWGAVERLPTTLTRLDLAGGRSEQLPTQVRNREVDGPLARSPACLPTYLPAFSLACLRSHHCMHAHCTAMP